MILIILSIIEFIFEFLCSSLFNKLRFQSSHEPKWRTGVNQNQRIKNYDTQLDKIFIYHLKQNKLFSFLNVLIEYWYFGVDFRFVVLER
jgi:hypothetical protein